LQKSIFFSNFAADFVCAYVQAYITINLNGHKLDRHLSQRGEGGGQVITVRSGATLNLRALSR